MKKLLLKHTNRDCHWVGDGFPVRTIFGYHHLAKDLSPFLMMDYAGPEKFEPSPHIRGVGEHPHRGFETVTIVYSGEVEHRDSAGGGGSIGPGDVQWMTAASGLVHEEMHGKDFAKNGGIFEMIQLWVNLPAKDKKAKPRYQEIKSAQIPKISLPENAGFVRVIAGQYAEARGPTETFTPINLWDIRLLKTGRAVFTVPTGHTTSVFVLSGRVRLEGGEILGATEIGILEKSGDSFSLTAEEEAKILFLGGEPIDEPIVGHGPFVMNTVEEIHQAIRDYQEGRMGAL